MPEHPQAVNEKVAESETRMTLRKVTTVYGRKSDLADNYQDASINLSRDLDRVRSWEVRELQNQASPGKRKGRHAPTGARRPRQLE